MKQIINQIVSNNTGKAFIVKWDSKEQTAWLEISGADIMVGKNTKTDEEAIDTAQIFIDSQPELY
ncbi:MAG: hypothetical protein WCH34_16700 [Bacteroidota bacterium]